MIDMKHILRKKIFKIYDKVRNQIPEPSMRIQKQRK